MKYKWQLMAMICFMVAGTCYLIYKRSGSVSRPPFSKIELLKDSLIRNDLIMKKANAFSNWAEINMLKSTISNFSAKDSLTKVDQETIKNIDQQLNRILHERN